MGFILWLTDGFIDCLEGFSYQEPTDAVDLETVGFEIVQGDIFYQFLH